MVVARHVGGFADQLGQPGARCGVDRQPGEDPVARPMPAMAKDVGQVLVQRAAERDVEHLGAATDAQHGHPPLKRAPQ
ncbi:Uncharacterised protein [Mycobacterium tuberculosis]|uniref:Uncharacterized protein n=1 Tax=Mycobacterium tuberculosis TaxID=1773 RepID=A0A916P9N0_MYCTX|nr:Uncharacterised protein [Mycobacterium tuberculosis]COZ60207.1 Uncharacterised protein [Mycobacterium tuberculosis]COZ90503.1 Uncharacterised protein [Mycobacterium tuberculosis]CPA51731.1 Uncharacterised protein [Mycobacterium tuberculosis]